MLSHCFLKTKPVLYSFCQNICDICGCCVCVKTHSLGANIHSEDFRKKEKKSFFFLLSHCSLNNRCCICKKKMFLKYCRCLWHLVAHMHRGLKDLTSVWVTWICILMTVVFWRQHHGNKCAEHIRAKLAMMQSIRVHVLVSVWQLCDLEILKCWISIHITIP